MLRARGVRVDGLEVADEAVLIDGPQRVPAAEDVLVDRRAAQANRPAVESQLGADRTNLSQADAGAVRRLARDLEIEIPEVRRLR